MEKIIVTGTEFNKGFEVFSQRSDMYEFVVSDPDEASLTKAIQAHNARFVIIGVDPYRDQLYQQLGESSVLARFGIGYENIDLNMASKRGIYCTNTPGVLTDSVAELTVGFLLEISRKIGSLNSMMKADEWSISFGGELKNKKLAILGCGQIGMRVAKILNLGFGMRLTGYDERAGQIPKVPYIEVFSDLERVVSDVDFISVHIPATKENSHYINEAFLDKLDIRTWIINTSRGKILDERALYSAIEKGKIGGAALDVFENEPYQPIDEKHDLRLFPNVIMTPHVGSSTREANERMALACLRNIDQAREGNFEDMNIINPQVLKPVID